MRVLIVCSRRNYAPFTGYVAPFIYEQVEELRSLGIECDFYLVSGGKKGYLEAIREIRKIVRTATIDLIHAHYGLCGVVANCQRIVPVVTTYHGSDINNKGLRLFSSLAMSLSRQNIVVSRALFEKAPFKKRVHVIPCGVSSSFLVPMDRKIARNNLGWPLEERYVLFSKEFYNPAKNYPLAKAAIDQYNRLHPTEPEAKLIEFIGFSREQVLWLYNAVNCVIMTSNQEGSPQFIKEAMACNCPIVSVDVGDVKNVIAGVDGCYLAKRNVEDIAAKLDQAMSFGKTTGRDKVIKEYDAPIVAMRIAQVYHEVINNE